MRVELKRFKLTDRWSNRLPRGLKCPIFMDDEVIGFGVQVRETDSKSFTSTTPSRTTPTAIHRRFSPIVWRHRTLNTLLRCIWQLCGTLRPTPDTSRRRGENGGAICPRRRHKAIRCGQSLRGERGQLFGRRIIWQF